MSKNSKKNSTFGNISFGNKDNNFSYNYRTENSNPTNSSNSSVLSGSSMFSSPFGTPFRTSQNSAFSLVSPVRETRTTNQINVSHGSSSSMNSSSRRIFNPFYTPLVSPSSSPQEFSDDTEEYLPESSTLFTETTVSTEPIPESTNPNFENLNLPPHNIPNHQLQNLIHAIANQNSTMGPQNPFNQPIIPMNYESNNNTSTSSVLSDISTTGGFISYKKFLGK
jgi:hypothetical protein